MNSERRRAPRYQFVAEAEVTEILSETMLKAKTGDLSVGGCFLDMLNSWPEGTEIRIRILYSNTIFSALGRVAFVVPQIGMGVVFTSVDADQSAILEKWLSELGNMA